MAIKLLTAKQARLRFVDEEFVESLKTINEAILDASTSGHRVTVDIPTGPRENGPCRAFHVAQRLRENGFEVILIHDSENGSSELTVDWSSIVGECAE